MPICTACSLPVDSLFVRYGKDHVVLARCSRPTTAAPKATSAAEHRDAAEPHADAADASASTFRLESATGAGRHEDKPNRSPTNEVEDDGNNDDKEGDDDDDDEEGAGCGAFADPYLEHGLAVVILDLMLVKPRAYRHLLYNRPTLTLPTDTQLLSRRHAFSSPPANALARYTTLLKRFVALLLIDAYLRWFYLCIHPSPPALDGRLTSVSRELETNLCTLPLRARLWGAGNPSEAAKEGNGAVAAEAGVVESYLIVLAVTTVEMVVFHLCVGLGTSAAVQMERWWRRRRRRSLPHDADMAAPRRSTLDLYTPDLAPTSMLLSQLSTLLLLALILLWHSKLPRNTFASTQPVEPHRPLASAQPMLASFDAFARALLDRLPRWPIDATIRALVGGLSAGVALGVVVPHRPAISMGVLLLAWAAQAAVAHRIVAWAVS
ncbi:sterol homeostasis protein [Thecaphora frezii]